MEVLMILQAARFILSDEEELVSNAKESATYFAFAHLSLKNLRQVRFLLAAGMVENVGASPCRVAVRRR